MEYAKGLLIDDSLVDAQEAARVATRRALGDYVIPDGELSLVSNRTGDQCVFELRVAQCDQGAPLTIAVARVDAKTLVAIVEIRNLKLRLSDERDGQNLGEA